MIKVNILNLEKFFSVVNQCIGCVIMINTNGRKNNITRNYVLQDDLRDMYRKNNGSLSLDLDFENSRDYMAVVSYYAGDC